MVPMMMVMMMMSLHPVILALAVEENFSPRNYLDTCEKNNPFSTWVGLLLVSVLLHQPVYLFMRVSHSLGYYRVINDEGG